MGLDMYLFSYKKIGEREENNGKIIPDIITTLEKREACYWRKQYGIQDLIVEKAEIGNLINCNHYSISIVIIKEIRDYLLTMVNWKRIGIEEGNVEQLNNKYNFDNIWLKNGHDCILLSDEYYKSKYFKQDDIEWEIHGILTTINAFNRIIREHTKDTTYSYYAWW